VIKRNLCVGLIDIYYIRKIASEEITHNLLETHESIH